MPRLQKEARKQHRKLLFRTPRCLHHSGHVKGSKKPSGANGTGAEELRAHKSKSWHQLRQEQARPWACWAALHGGTNMTPSGKLLRGAGGEAAICHTDRSALHWRNGQTAQTDCQQLKEALAGSGFTQGANAGIWGVEWVPRVTVPQQTSHSSQTLHRDGCSVKTVWFVEVLSYDTCN